MKTAVSAGIRENKLPESTGTRQTGAQDVTSLREGTKFHPEQVAARSEVGRIGEGTGKSLPHPADRDIGSQRGVKHSGFGGADDSIGESLPHPTDSSINLQDVAERGGKGRNEGGTGERFSHPVPGLPACSAAGFPHPDIKTISTPALAYLGDAVIELFVRKQLVAEGLSSSKTLNRRALNFVRASAQAAAMERLLPYLTNEEASMFRRGRNIGHTNTPKSATVAEYRNATGMEVLFGYLHMTGRTDRAAALFLLAYQEEKST